MMNTICGDVRTERDGAVIASGTLSTIIIGPFNLGRRPTKTFTLVNYGPFTLSGARVEVNPDDGGFEVGPSLPAEQVPQVGLGDTASRRRPPDPSLWHSYDANAFTSMASGEVRSLVANDLFRWWRIVGTNNTSGNLSASGWVNASTF